MNFKPGIKLKVYRCMQKDKKMSYFIIPCPLWSCNLATTHLFLSCFLDILNKGILHIHMPVLLVILKGQNIDQWMSTLMFHVHHHSVRPQDEWMRGKYWGRGRGQVLGLCPYSPFTLLNTPKRYPYLRIRILILDLLIL